MQWIPILQTAFAFLALGILTAGTLILKHRLKKRIFDKSKEYAYV